MKHQILRPIFIAASGFILLGILIYTWRGSFWGDPVFDRSLRKTNGDVVAALKDVGRTRENEQGEIISLSLDRFISRNRGPNWYHNNTVLKYVKQVKTIKTLGFGATAKIDDRGMGHVAEMIQLENLNLNGLKITDKGLRKLQSLTNLKRISLYATRVTDEGVAEFKKSLPECEVLYGSPLR